MFNQSYEKNHTILCVDDEIEILHTIQRVLRKESFELITTTTPNKAIEIFQHKKIDIIISDLKMPHMSGTQLLTYIKEQYPSTIRLVLSGYADTNMVLDTINKAEIYRFISKPWDEKNLIQCIHDGINKLDNENYEITKIQSLENVISSIPIPAMIIDDDMKIHYKNDSCAEQIPSFNKIEKNNLYEILSEKIVSQLQDNIKHQNHQSIDLSIDDYDFKIFMKSFASEEIDFYGSTLMWVPGK